MNKKIGLCDATEIQIFGPEVAKYELLKRLEDEGLWEHVVSVEQVGKLTDLEIAAKVQKRFPLRSRLIFPVLNHTSEGNS